VPLASALGIVLLRTSTTFCAKARAWVGLRTAPGLACPNASSARIALVYSAFGASPGISVIPESATKPTISAPLATATKPRVTAAAVFTTGAACRLPEGPGLRLASVNASCAAASEVQVLVVIAELLKLGIADVRTILAVRIANLIREAVRIGVLQRNVYDVGVRIPTLRIGRKRPGVARIGTGESPLSGRHVACFKVIEPRLPIPLLAGKELHIWILTATLART
jgi:hypothetical protein